MSRVFALQPSPTEPAPPADQAPRRGVAGVRPAAGEAATLHEAWAQRVRGCVGFRVRDADDLVSEVFRRVVSGPAPVEPAARPAWIFRVTHNVVVDHYRRRRIALDGHVRLATQRARQEWPRAQMLDDRLELAVAANVSGQALDRGWGWEPRPAPRFRERRATHGAYRECSVSRSSALWQTPATRFAA